MRPAAVVIIGVSSENSTQMALADRDHVVEALAPYRADNAFNIAVLPRSPWRNRTIADPHGPDTALEHVAIGAVIVADEEL